MQTTATTPTTDPEPKTMPRVCEICDLPFAARYFDNPLNGKPFLIRDRCDPCDTRIRSERERAEAEEARANEEKARRELWEGICPWDYRTTDENGPTDQRRLLADQPKLAQILAHPLGSRGLILRGPTGARKTRAMYRLMRVYFDLPRRPKIIAMTAGEFDRQARDAAGNFTLTEWFRRLASARVLFIDDLGKGSWTKSTAGQFWEVVDDRTRNGRPIFATTNYSGEALTKALNLDGDTAPALLRRLREHCDGIVLLAEETGK